MSDRPTHGWCPSCKEESAIDIDRRCLWCGAETRKRGRGGKPKGVHGKLEDRHLRALHRLHTEQGLSLRELGRRSRQNGGYRACKGIKRQPPGKGQPCTRWALVGSDYCYAHDPSRREEIVTHAAEMRARIGVAA